MITSNHPFKSQLLETSLPALEVIGKIPDWIEGYFLSNGPAQFEINGYAFRHWFDGFSMLKKFQFFNGQVSFQNKFLRSKQYQHACKYGTLNTNEFASIINRSMRYRIFLALKEIIHGNQYDNCNVNITRLADSMVALTESSHQLTIDAQTLETIGPYIYTDKLYGQLTTAHPYVDQNTGEIINLAISIGKNINYHLFTIKPGTRNRHIFSTYRTNDLFYIHSFAVTSRYVVLLNSPLKLNRLDLLYKPFNKALFINTKQSYTDLILINRETNETTTIRHEPGFVCLHVANAYDEQDKLVLDLVCYGITNPYDSLCLNNLRHPHPLLPQSKLVRIILAPKKATYETETLSASTQEFPRLNSINEGYRYKYLYTTAFINDGCSFFNLIQKTNVTTRDILTWGDSRYAIGEAIFVPKPGANGEDDGVLMTIAYDYDNNISALIMIDANNMQTVATALLPMYLPIGLHGHFFK